MRECAECVTIGRIAAAGRAVGRGMFFRKMWPGKGRRTWGVFCCAPLLAVLVLAGWAAPRSPVTAAEPGVSHLRLKVKFTVRGENGRQRGKVWMMCGQSRAKILFLSPLNQVVAQLFIEDDRALLINRKKKKYWRGPADRLIRSVWRLDLSWEELRGWLLEDRAPEERLAGAGMWHQSERDVAGALRQISVGDGVVTVRLKVLDRRTRPGGVTWDPDPGGSAAAELEQVFADD